MPPTLDIQATTNLNYPITAYFLPHHDPSSSSLSPPLQLITCAVTLTQTNWSVDLEQAFPDNINTDAYFIHVPLSKAPPVCFCGRMRMDANEEQSEEQWDQYWECTAICKQRRGYKAYMQEKMGNGGMEYIVFVEGDTYDGDGDVPLLERIIDSNTEVPMWHRRIVMIKVKGWVPVDVKPVGIGGQQIPDAKENELTHLKNFLKTKCNDESAWKGRFL